MTASRTGKDGEPLPPGFFAKYLRRERERLLLSKADLAQRWGLSEAAVVAIESGSARIDQRDVPTLAFILGKTPEEVLSAAGFPQKSLKQTL